MVNGINYEVVGRTTMRVLYTSETKETSSTKETDSDFEEVLNTVTEEEETKEVETKETETKKTSSTKETNTKKSVDLEEIFNQASKTYGVPVYLLKAVAKAESNFDANDVSKSGAMGIMQLMPETAKELGVKNAFDPEENIMGGAKYLADKLTEYDGDVDLALAAYNAGSGNVKKYGGIPPFEQTQNYVKKVNAYMEEYKQSSKTEEVGNISTNKTENLKENIIEKEDSKSDNLKTTSENTANNLNLTSDKNTTNVYMQAYERMKDTTYWKVLQ